MTNVEKVIKEHYKKIGSIGGKKSKRTWSDEQKKEMVAKKAKTLEIKKRLK